MKFAGVAPLVAVNAKSAGPFGTVCLRIETVPCCTFVNVQRATSPSLRLKVAVGPLPGPLGVTVPGVRPGVGVTAHSRPDRVQPLGGVPSVTVRVEPAPNVDELGEGAAS